MSSTTLLVGIFWSLFSFWFVGATNPAVIIDTDADIDDWWAIAYLLKVSTIDIKAIIVDGNAWSDPVFGAQNIMNLVDLMGCPNSTLVAYGEGTSMLQPGNPGSSVPSNLKAPIDRYWTSCLGLTLLEKQPTVLSGAELVVDIIASSPTKISYLILGSMTTLAAALIRDRSILDKIETVFVSGGKYSSAITAATWPYQTKTKGSSWNIFVDPLASQRVFNSGLKLELFTSDAQAQLVFNSTAAQNYLTTHNISALNPPELWPLISQFSSCTNQSESAIAYWDPSAAIYMVERLKNGSAVPTLCTNLTAIKTVIVLDDGGTFGWTRANPDGVSVLACATSDLNLFYDQFYPALATPSICPPSISIPLDQEIDGSLLALQAQLNNLTSRVQALEAESHNSSTPRASLSLALLLILASFWLL